MVKELKCDISTIPSIQLKDEPMQKIYDYKQLITSKPRSSVRDIDQSYRIVKIFRSLGRES